jgi:hypothetical protein
MDLRQHIRVISSAPDEAVAGRIKRPQRVLSMVAVVMVALLLGAALGRALPMKPEAGAVAQSPSPTPASTETFVYFPSQYVNQATAVEEHIQAY